MTSDSTAEFLDGFKGDLHGWVSEAAARCFKNADPRKGNPTARSVLAFEDGTLWNPLISAASAAAQGRPAWRDMVRSVWPERQGQRMLCILTTDQKKRLWIRARVGTMGACTPVLCYDSALSMNEVRLLDWPQWLRCLDLVEQVYTLGFPKEVISGSLYIASKVCQAVGLGEVRRLERLLQDWRERPEFGPALLIAQKKEQAS